MTIKQSLRDVELMYKIIGGYDMKYDEFKELYRIAWSQKFKYLCIFWLKIKTKVTIVYSKRAKTYILKAFTKLNLLNNINLVLNQR